MVQIPAYTHYRIFPLQNSKVENYQADFFASARKFLISFRYDIFKLGSVYMDSIGTSTTTSFVIPNTLSTQTHWFSVRSRGPLSSVGRRANAIQKTPGVFSCPVVTGVESNSTISQNVGFTVFPNPGYGLYTVALSGLNNVDVSYRIIDISGKEIKNADLGKQTGDFNTNINIEGVSNGIYTLILNRGGVSNYIKLCKF
jgi:hypothetical protein